MDADTKSTVIVAAFTPLLQTKRHTDLMSIHGASQNDTQLLVQLQRQQVVQCQQHQVV